MFDTCRVTVAGLITSASPISALVLPAATSATTSRSRGESGIVSPDGDKVAHIFSESADNGSGWFVEILSLTTGERRQTEVFSPADRRRLVWSPDSRYVFFQARPEAEGSRHLFQLSAEDGSLRPVMEAEDIIRHFSVSPDGRHVAMDSGEVRQEIWRMTFNNGR